MSHNHDGVSEESGGRSYFFEVKNHLATKGEAMISTPAVDPFNSSTVRGAQLAAEIQAILDVTGHAKVNIIGHSQGGLDARVVAHNHPSGDVTPSVQDIDSAGLSVNQSPLTR